MCGKKNLQQWTWKIERDSEIIRRMMSLFPSETTTMNATVYWTRGCIRQRFITILLWIINSTYSHHDWCVYVLYPGVMTIARDDASLGTGGGGCPRGGNTTDSLAFWNILFLHRWSQRNLRRLHRKNNNTPGNNHKTQHCLPILLLLIHAWKWKCT